MAGAIVAILEQREGKLAEVSLEVVSAAQRLAGDGGMDLVAVLPGAEPEATASELKGFGGQLICLQSEELAHYNWERYCAALEPVLREVGPAMVIAGHTTQGMDLGPRLAAMLDMPYLPDCIDIKLEDGKPLVIRELYSGKVRTEMAPKSGMQAFITVRPGEFQPADQETGGASTTKKEVSIRKDGFLTEFLGIEAPEVADVDITRAELVVGVGRGFGDKDKIRVAEEFAEAAGGVIAASRPVIDYGWLPRSRQVGQSGKTIRPKIYIACGISGAHQHIVGIKKADTIIAINTDPKAPIFRVAHYGVVGDVFEVLPALTKRIKME